MEPYAHAPACVQIWQLAAGRLSGKLGRLHAATLEISFSYGRDLSPIRRAIRSHYLDRMKRGVKVGGAGLFQNKSLVRGR